MWFSKERLSKRDKRFLNIAVEAAKTSTAKQRHGCVVVKNGNIWAISANVNVNHPAQMSEEHVKDGASIHAEMRALSVIPNPKGVTIYVARINKSDDTMLSAPCARCQDALQSLGVKKIVHT